MQLDAPYTEPFPPRTVRKRRRIGPHSRRISFGSLDLRTREGQFAADIRAALSEQLGGNPSPAQQLLIQSAAIKALRCELLLRQVLSEQEIKAHNDHHLLAWMNGLRRDLETLGLKPTATNPGAALDAWIASLPRAGEAA